MDSKIMRKLFVGMMALVILFYHWTENYWPYSYLFQSQFSSNLNLVPISLPYHSKLEDDVLIQKKKLEDVSHSLIALTMNLEVVKAGRGRL